MDKNLGPIGLPKIVSTRPLTTLQALDRLFYLREVSDVCLHMPCAHSCKTKHYQAVDLYIGLADANPLVPSLPGAEVWTDYAMNEAEWELLRPRPLGASQVSYI